MKIKIPGRETLEIENIILDLNGTLAIGGRLINGVEPRIKRLQKAGLKFILFSGDTRGNAATIAKRLGIELIRTENMNDKARAALKLNPTKSAAIGNGYIDVGKFTAVKLGIAVLQAEGIHTKLFLCSDIIVPSIRDALDLFIDPSRLIATLRQ
jgi:soluble P-type ATPase